MATIKLCAVLVIGVLSLAVVTRCCEDVHVDSCMNMLQTRADLCSEEFFSKTMCPKTCGQCPVACFHCDDPVENYNECNDTRTCELGQKCMLTEVHSSSKFAQHEYRMVCASVDMCDGSSIFFGRRDISTHCCDADLCNHPEYGPTTTTTTLTTTPLTTQTTTLPGPTCNRDIVIMVEDSTNHEGEPYIKTFLHNLASSINIGAASNLVGLALFDTRIHDQWHMDSSQTSSMLATSINNLQFTHSTDSDSYTTVLKFVSDYVNNHRYGDRTTIPDVVIILVDQRTSGSFSHHPDRVNIDHNSRNIVVINVGEKAIKYDAFGRLVRNQNYVLNLPGYANLTSIQPELQALICT